MNILKISAILLLLSINSWAQDVATRNIPLKIVDRKGRPISNVLVKSINTEKAGITDRSGIFVFTEMTDDDIISVTIPKYGENTIPVARMDSILIIQKSTRRYAYLNNERESIIFDRNTTQSNTILNVPAMIKDRPSDSLFELLQGQVAGLNMSYNNGTEEVNIRGGSSRVSSNEPLVVVNGIVVGLFSDANRMLNISDIQTIEVRKNGVEYGSRGSNGVILITTKTAFSQ